MQYLHCELREKYSELCCMLTVTNTANFRTILYTMHVHCEFCQG
jgi:hypothetical protein